MADITTLTEATTLSATDLLYSVINPGTTPLDRKITLATAQKYTQGGVALTWPASNAAGALTNNGSGVLSWSAAAGTVTSVAMTVPTGLSVAGSPITSSGTLALSLTAGYAIPLSADTAAGVTANSWGNHASAGYAVAASYVGASTIVTVGTLVAGAVPTTLITGILGSANGGTGNGFAKLSGPTTTERTFTLPDASATILTTNAAVTVAQGGTGATTLTGLLQGNGTSAVTAITDSSTVGQTLRVTGAATYAWGALDLADGDAVTGVLPLANGGNGVSLSDPNADRLKFWDDSAGSLAWLTPGAGLDLTDTTLVGTFCLAVAASDETTQITAGTGKLTFRMPFAMTLTAVRASLTTAPTGGVITIDINESGTTILSTKLTIDATEKTSTTAATAAVISDTSLADDAEMTVDVDSIVTTGGTGLKIYLIGKRA